MCVYRNHLFYGKKKIYFIIVHVLVELFLYFLIFMYNFYKAVNTNGLPIDIQCFYYFLSVNIFSSDVICSLYGLYKGRAYKKFVINFLTLHSIYKKDIHYVRNLKQLQIIFLTTFSAMFIISLTFIVINTGSILKFGSSSFVETFFLNFAVLHCEVCFTLEYLVIYIFLSLLSNILNSLNGTLVVIERQVQKENKTHSDTNRQTCSSNVAEKIQQSTELYKRITDLSNELSECFKLQVNMNSLGSNLPQIVLHVLVRRSGLSTRRFL